MEELDDVLSQLETDTSESVSSGNAGSPSGTPSGTGAATGLVNTGVVTGTGSTVTGAMTGTGTDSPLVVTEGSSIDAEFLTTYLTQQAETETLVLESIDRIEVQIEACISILMIFLVVGALNYIYKLFKMFF